MKLLGVLSVACVPAIAAAQPVVPSVAGSYVGTQGPTILYQDGDRVRGSYAQHNGRIDGTLHGRTLAFSWAEDDGVGRGVFTVGDDGNLYGMSGRGDSDSNRGSWIMQRGSEATFRGSASTVAPAVTRASPRGWQSQLRMPWDVYLGRNDLVLGAIGIGLDTGWRANAHWYVGATSDVEMVSIVSLAFPPQEMDPDKTVARLRLGGEVRYYFDDGVGGMRVNHGPWRRIPTHKWVGLRAGAESFDRFATVGEFADLSAGVSFGLGSTAFGVYGAFGLSRQPASAYNPTATGSSSAWGGTFGMSLAFGG
jgi:hypothetical protein